MAESEYKVLKTRIEELIENIESIDKEAASFSAAKSELIEISGNLHDISSDLAKAIKTSEAVLDQVESIAVKSTLQSMKESAEMYAETSENFLCNAKATYEKQANYFQEKVDSLSEQYLKAVQQSDDNFVESRDILLSQSKAIYADHAQEIQNRIDSLTAVLNENILIMEGKVDSLSEQYQQSVQHSADNFVEAMDSLLSQSKAVYADHAQELQNRINFLTADFNKKLLIMGGIAIASSIVALICSFI